MTEKPHPDDKVEILPPDKSLLMKIGTNNLDAVFSPGIAQAAEDVIKNHNNDFRTETLEEIDQLVTLSKTMADDTPDHVTQLGPIIEIAFSIKANAGLAGYDLISAIAKSLYLYCEAQNNKAFGRKTREIIDWHTTSLRQMVNLNVKGKGGMMGETIMAELAKLVP